MCFVGAQPVPYSLYLVSVRKQSSVALDLYARPGSSLICCDKSPSYIRSQCVSKCFADLKLCGWLDTSACGLSYSHATLTHASSVPVTRARCVSGPPERLMPASSRSLRKLGASEESHQGVTVVIHKEAIFIRSDL
jgi:hypothetical protein